MLKFVLMFENISKIISGEAILSVKTGVETLFSFFNQRRHRLNAVAYTDCWNHRIAT